MVRILSAACVLIAFLISPLLSQDVHFTNFSSSQQNLNPALSGNFRGTMKLGGIYRDQFSQFFDAQNNGYKSLGIFLEHNLNLTIREGDWLSVGGFIDNDKGGDLGFGSTRTGLNVGYHLAAGSQHIITLGIQGVFINRGVDPNLASTETSLRTGGGHGEELVQLIEGYQGSQFDYSVGLTHKMYINKKMTSTVGVALYHLSASNKNFAQSSNLDYIPLRFNAHAELLIKTGNRTGIRPRIYYYKSEQASAMSLQLLNGFQLAKQSIELGVGYRLADAIQFLINVPVKGWNVNAAFDMTTSTAKAYNNSFGAFEIGLHKIITKNPKAKVEFIQLCPRL